MKVWVMYLRMYKYYSKIIIKIKNKSYERLVFQRFIALFYGAAGGT